MSEIEKVLVEHLDGSTSWAVPNPKHPAVYSDAIVETMASELATREWPGRMVLDPFAGKGVKLGEISRQARTLGRSTHVVGVEIEPEWAACGGRMGPDPMVFVGDSTKLPAKWSGRFGAAVTSPCYGNRFADSHTPNDACKRCDGVGLVQPESPVPGLAVKGLVVCPLCKGSKLSPRRSYTHDLGRKLTENNAGAMHYGPAYRELHRDVWAEVHRVLKPGGLFLMNIKDHIRDGRRVRVMEWHRRTIEKLGFAREATITIPLGGLRHGANRERVSNEVVYVFRKA